MRKINGQISIESVVMAQFPAFRVVTFLNLLTPELGCPNFATRIYRQRGQLYFTLTEMR